MEETRTQIKFSSPDIDGTPKPQLLTLEQETPIEGTSEKEDGSQFVWHKWLCTGDQYFMASDSLDGMLKLIPNKMGTVLKIGKVLNPKGGYPFFEVNGMNRDQILTSVNASNMQASIPKSDIDPVVPQMAQQPPSAAFDNATDRIEQKLDTLISMMKPKEEEIPF